MTTHLLISSDGRATPLSPSAMASIGWKERADLQRWLREQPELIAPDLLLIAEEFDRWSGAGGASAIRDRLDLLFLDSDGRALVAELKLGAAPDRTESQALQYAGFVNRLQVNDLIAIYAEASGLGKDEAEAALFEHAPSLRDGELGRVRIRLVAESFSTQITSTVHFLRELGADDDGEPLLDIGCIRVTARPLPGGAHIVDATTIIPPPDIENLLVAVRRRKVAEERAGTQRKRNAIPLIQEAGVIPVGTSIVPNYEWLGSKAETIREAYEAAGAAAHATWAGATSSKVALIVGWQEEPASFSAHYVWLRTQAGLKPQSGEVQAFIAELDEGPRSLWSIAEELRGQTPARGRPTVAVLNEAHRRAPGTGVAPGQEVELLLRSLRGDRAAAVERFGEADPERLRAEWTGEASSSAALRWKADGETYSMTGLVHAILEAADADPMGSIAGPDHWVVVGDDESLYAKGKRLDAALRQDAATTV